MHFVGPENDAAAVAVAGKPRQLSFGSVTLRVDATADTDRPAVTELSPAALGKLTSRLVKAGVVIKAGRGVPMFRADPAAPDRVIRTWNGRRESGIFVQGEFRPVG
jgi:hypothetical protein